MNKSEDSKESFLNYFSEQGILISLALSVYKDIYQRHLFKRPVKPNDDLYKMHGIVDEDLDDLVVEVAEANNFEIPPNTDYWQEPVITVENLIRFIASFPRKENWKDFC